MFGKSNVPVIKMLKKLNKIKSWNQVLWDVTDWMTFEFEEDEADRCLI